MISVLKLPDYAPHGPALVHSDAFRTRFLVQGVGGRKQILEKHIKNLEFLAGQRPLWLPTFNYDFCMSGTYDVLEHQSQVGPISEYFRKEISVWRSECPVFNFAGNDQSNTDDNSGLAVIDPFGRQSQFAKLIELGGSIVWYGAPISATTLIHYAEHILGGPLYRYDKSFFGNVVSGDHIVQNVELVYHVRPRNMDLDYDWQKIESNLSSLGLIHTLNDSVGCYWASTNDLIECWIESLKKDPLYFLSENTRKWVEPLLSKLGRRFEINDFEYVGD